MDWFALPLFLGFHLPIFWAVQRLTHIPMILPGLVAITLYYAGYEALHYFMHVPRDRWIEKTRVFKFLNEHHRLHHKDDTKNLNVLIPIADLTLGTMWRPKKASKTATQPALPRKPRPAKNAARS